MKYPDAPVLYNECRAGLGATIFYAGVIRDDALPARCALCGFQLDDDGRQLPESQKDGPLDPSGRIERAVRARRAATICGDEGGRQALKSEA